MFEMAQQPIQNDVKDTVPVMPGGHVRMPLRFEDYEGLFLYHCHMLEHEDSGLMRNYLIEA